MQGADVKVTRWFPGVLQSIVEEVKSKSEVSKSITVGGDRRGSVRSIVAKEATTQLENKRNVQIAATKEKSLNEIKAEMGIPVDSPAGSPEPITATGEAGGAAAPPSTTRRRVRQKMRSTPVVGGSLFDDPKPSAQEEPKDKAAGGGGGRTRHTFSSGLGGQSAELVIGGDVFKIRVMPETVHRIRSGYSGELLDDASVKFSQEDVPIEHRLQGFVRTADLQTISEDVSDTASNNGSENNADGNW